jgi:hypothetical protein
MTAVAAFRRFIIGCALLQAAAAECAELQLCVNGHPTARPPHVTYGGLPGRRGYERDHCVPLGLGGPDTPANVWYQPWPEALRKDEIEDREIEAYCRAEITLAEAQALFTADRCVPGAW